MSAKRMRMSRASFVGRITSTCAIAVMLVGCATRPGLHSIRVGEVVPLTAGVPVALPDRSKLVYLGLHADSRCPKGVACIHAGSVEVRFRHMDAAGVATEARVEAPRTTAVDLRGGWRLFLSDVDGMSPEHVHVRVERRH